MPSGLDASRSSVAARGLVLGERLELYQYVGALLVIGAVIAILRGSSRASTDARASLPADDGRPGRLAAPPEGRARA